ncbi:hypothetical protein Tcan_00753, partial [Toxocara canis]
MLSLLDFVFRLPSNTICSRYSPFVWRVHIPQVACYLTTMYDRTTMHAFSYRNHIVASCDIRRSLKGQPSSLQTADTFGRRERNETRSYGLHIRCYIIRCDACRFALRLV